MTTEKNKKNRILITLVIVMPLLIAFILVCIQAIIQHVFLLPMPAWNDEAAYYSLVKTWLANGQPLGYYGFNGGHAILGTGSGWSFAVVIPYAIFGWIFSWNYSSVFFANVFFLCVAHALFVILTKPGKEKLIRVLILQITSVISILYITTSMSEPLRYGMVIVLAGMFYRLYFMEAGKIFKYIIFPIYILLISQVYIFLVFSVFIYVMGILKNKKGWLRILYSLVSMGGVAAGSYYLLHLISSNYNIYKTENLFAALKRFDVLAVLIEFSKNVKEGICSMFSIWEPYVGHGMFLWFVPLCIIFVLVPLILGITKRRNKRIDKKTDGILCFLVAYSVGLFLFMYISVYSLERFTFFRGVGIVLIFSMYLFVMLEERKIYLMFALLYGIGIIFLPMNMKDFNVERYLPLETRAEWKQLEYDLEDIIPIEKTDDPWENTVAVYTLEPRVLMSLPAGVGINMMMDSSVFAKDAEYILLPIKKKDILRSDWLDTNYVEFENQFETELNLYQVIYEKKGLKIYREKNIRFSN